MAREARNITIIEREPGVLSFDVNMETVIEHTKIAPKKNRDGSELAEKVNGEWVPKMSGGSPRIANAYFFPIEYNGRSYTLTLDLLGKK